ncbi:hypothetical protein Clacol_010510 [Clathrus columnatus]|uniref:Transmembrane protein n=1 Tax=Clathrus columnatus TaxID=1419009 RepID=A0AAV5ANM7_9AGAM|nr:hypothetical protein Clacol_010510 [Clathrus columnatus]
MPTSLVVPSPVQVVFYYVFHIIFLGHPADILARLWLTHDLAHPEDLGPDEDYETNVRNAWRNFEESIRESYRTVGVLAGLVAATTSLFFSVTTDISNTTVRTLFLASVTTAVLSAASSFTSLSTVLPDPIAIEQRWEESGLGFIIALAGPSAWLSLSLWTFQAALLALVWITDETPARVVVTLLISLRVLLRVTVATSATGFREFCRGLLGWRYGADHRMIQLTTASITMRKKYLEWCNQTPEEVRIPTDKISRTSSAASETEAPKRRVMIQETTLVSPVQRTTLPIAQRPHIQINQRAVRAARLFVASPEANDDEIEPIETTVIPAITKVATVATI